MTLSAFSILDSYPEFEDGGRDRYRELLDLAPRLEGAGFRALWVAEHHFHPGGACPTPPVLLAAAGERSRLLRFGVMVSVLPFHSSVDVAEQYALLDRLLEGRLDLGLGSGYLPQEFEGFGIDPATKRERFDRGLDELLALWRGEPVAAGGAPVRLNVLPSQRPHPPYWIAAQRREAVPFVARRGANLGLVPYATVSSLEELRGVIGEYRSALPEGRNGRVSAALHLYAGPEPERARHALERFLETRRSTQSTFYLEKSRRDPHAAGVAGLESSGLAILDRPRDAIARLEEFRATGVDEVLAILDFGGLPAPLVGASVQALAPAAGAPEAVSGRPGR